MKTTNIKREKKWLETVLFNSLTMTHEFFLPLFSRKVSLSKGYRRRHRLVTLHGHTAGNRGGWSLLLDWSSTQQRQTLHLSSTLISDGETSVSFQNAIYPFSEMLGNVILLFKEIIKPLQGFIKASNVCNFHFKMSDLIWWKKWINHYKKCPLIYNPHEQTHLLLFSCCEKLGQIKRWHL